MIAVRHDAQRHRYEVYDDQECAGFAAYQPGTDQITFTHTEVDRKFSGRGMARRLVTEALDDARRRGMAVLPLCPYVRRVIALCPDQYLDLVPMRDRERFELPAEMTVEHRASSALPKKLLEDGRTRAESLERARREADHRR